MGCLQLAANCSKLETLRINNFATLSDNHLRVLLSIFKQNHLQKLSTVTNLF